MIRDSSVGYIVMILVSYLVYTMGLTNESARKQVKLYQHKIRQILVNFGFKLYSCGYFIQTAMLVLVPVELRRLLHDCHANFGFVGKKTSCF